MVRSRGLLVLCALLILPLGAARSAEPGGGVAIALPQADRSALEALLGGGVVGAARPARPLPDSSAFMPGQGATWIYRFASGDNRGETEKVVLTRSPRDDTAESGRLDVGGKTIFYFQESGDGDLFIISEHNQSEGRITRFAPSEPVILSGMAPGTSKRTKATIKLYDLSDPKELTHQGTIDLTYSYLGVYEVTVPAGTFDGVLIKWHYKGDVGSASVEDTQYRFFAEGVGPLAMVDKTDISAFLVYQDHSKQGKVLVEKKQ